MSEVLMIKDRTSISDICKSLKEYLDTQKPTPLLIQIPDPIYPLFDIQSLSVEEFEMYAKTAEKLKDIAMKYNVAIQLVKHKEPMDMPSVSEGGKGMLFTPIFDFEMYMKDNNTPQEVVMIKNRRERK